MAPVVNSQPTTVPQMLLQGVTWETYQSLVKDLDSQPGKRLTYDNGNLEIFMPLPPHEKNKKYLARFVELVTEEWGIEICSLGSCTWSRQDLAKGVEADECYYIQNEAIVRGKMEIDLSVDPAPDLAIEIDITRLSLPRLPIYSALGVTEIWQFDGERVRLLSLMNGEYGEIAQSLALPGVTGTDVQHWLLQAQTMGETSWAKAVRRWAREQQ